MDIGDNAPLFALVDQNKKEWKLAGLNGKKVLLSFHPLAWTSVCTEQMKSLEKNQARFEQLNTIAFGVSVDSVPCKAAWAKDMGVEKTSLLADFWPHGKLAKDLGIFREVEGFSERANVIIDENGKIVFIKVYPILELPDIEEIIAKLG